MLGFFLSHVASYLYLRARTHFFRYVIKSTRKYDTCKKRKVEMIVWAKPPLTRFLVVRRVVIRPLSYIRADGLAKIVKHGFARDVPLTLEDTASTLKCGIVRNAKVG